MWEIMVSLKQICADETIKNYIEAADKNLAALGYTEHSFAHMIKSAESVKDILTALGYSEREIELGQIAGYLHDIGNVVNRSDHAHHGALMALQLLTGLGMPAGEIATIVSAIGHHDEGTAFPVSATAAALILADKSDVRRSRVRNQDRDTFDIHDRVNYAVESSQLLISTGGKTITLSIQIDTAISSVMEYFEIFIGRMKLCRAAANFFGYQFKLVINGTSLI